MTEDKNNKIEEKIRNIARGLYLERINNCLPGDQKSDWFKAKEIYENGKKSKYNKWVKAGKRFLFSFLIIWMLNLIFPRCLIPFVDKYLIHRNDLIKLNLLVIPKTSQEKDTTDYYFHLENKDNSVVLEDIDISMNFPWVIDREELKYNIGVSGFQGNIGEGSKNSNHAYIRIDKLSPHGVLLIVYYIRKEGVMKPPFQVWDIDKNICEIKYSYNCLGVSIHRTIKKQIPK